MIALTSWGFKHSPRQKASSRASGTSFSFSSVSQTRRGASRGFVWPFALVCDSFVWVRAVMKGVLLFLWWWRWWIINSQPPFTRLWFYTTTLSYRTSLHLSQLDSKIYIYIFLCVCATWKAMHCRFIKQFTFGSVAVFRARGIPAITDLWNLLVKTESIVEHILVHISTFLTGIIWLKEERC